MHELSITESIIAGVVDHVEGAKVAKVTVEIGELAAVAVEAVRALFPICAQGTVLEGAELEVLHVPGYGRCRDCGADVTGLHLPLLLCECGSANLEVLAGQRLLVRSVEVI